MKSGRASGENPTLKITFEAIFCLKDYFYSLRLFSKKLQKDPSKQKIRITSRGYFYFLRLFFALQGYF